MSNSTSTSSGPGCLTLLLVAFVVMKLAKIGTVAEWSWWWVLAPAWIGAILFVLVLVAGLVILARR